LYVWVGFGSMLVAPSPNSQKYDVIVPLGSVDSEPSNCMGVLSSPEYGPPASATGG